MVNRFNRLTSKEWLPFQKSWFRYESEEKLYVENLRFFCKAEPTEEAVYYQGNHLDLVKELALGQDIQLVDKDSFTSQSLQFALLDLREDVYQLNSIDDYNSYRETVLDIAEKIYNQLIHRRFLCIFIPNIQTADRYYPYAWDLGLQLSSLFSLKDEKIACMPESIDVQDMYFQPPNQTFYALYFRKDENSGGQLVERKHNLFQSHHKDLNVRKFQNKIPSWFILKPAPRKKDEVLHPAKYPEDLVTMFVYEFTEEDANILDPMSGTGSTQVASLKAGRNAYGTELSDFFAEIAQKRCQNLVQPTQADMFLPANKQQFKLINKDARLISVGDFPLIDYLITSPPYWDMLNMKGAENQAKRLEKGLQTNYSESRDDLGNIADYESFISDLVQVYINVLDVMKSGSHLTIVVKNIKKKGRNYPFAWDLADKLMTHLDLLPEVFWCQDDINLAPYGYGNTFVSNTFHQYCLNFRKP
ncbi:MAG: hypothetical protein IPN86_19835 [Saprospiraceae bacterium]|nr:hypothetical protein [Saprospiraceae bacterium]